jgi:hypothetical protein
MHDYVIAKWIDMPGDGSRVMEVQLRPVENAPSLGEIVEVLQEYVALQHSDNGISWPTRDGIQAARELLAQLTALS